MNLVKPVRFQWVVALVAILGNLCIASTSQLAADEEKPKSKHLGIAALRDRLLKDFHGQATDLFTSIPGFGMERMIPMYKYIPFEIPDLSTTEVEVEKEIIPPEILKEVFDRSVDGFRDSAKPLMGKKREPVNPFGGGKESGFGGHFGGTVVRGLQLRLLDLVGLTDPNGPKVYSGGKAFDVQRMSFEESKAKGKKPGVELDWTARPVRPKVAKDSDGHEIVNLETRPLDLFEMVGVSELGQGKDLFVRYRGNTIRMLGALRATEQCLKCHTDTKKGDLLGAFSYTFVDTNNSLAKDLKGTATK